VWMKALFRSLCSDVGLSFKCFSIFGFRSHIGWVMVLLK